MNTLLSLPLLSFCWKPVTHVCDGLKIPQFNLNHLFLNHEWLNSVSSSSDSVLIVYFCPSVAQNDPNLKIKRKKLLLNFRLDKETPPTNIFAFVTTNNELVFNDKSFQNVRTSVSR